MTAAIALERWPELPYRGLNYFRPIDRPLLTGRERDIVDCTMLLAHPKTRVLLLHGSTGRGKSSFLRAGLIPTMEEGGAYLFLKQPGGDDEALFIRSTEAPIDQIARQTYLFLTQEFTVQTPAGPTTVDLSSALLGCEDWEDFLLAARERDGLLASLREIARLIPHTIVLIVDQAEEVLTLNPSDENMLNRRRFFAFLREFQSLEFDARIIVALRTEFYGRFIDAVQVGYHTSAEFRQYLLEDLTRDTLVEAVLRPTSMRPVGTFGAPRDIYDFTFEEGLPEAIVDQILGARYSGPALPILQLVCLGLYQKLRRFEAALPIPERSGLIRHGMFAGEGGIQGLIIEHIKEAIRSAYPAEELFEHDVEEVRGFLPHFYFLQDDGSVVARSRRANWVVKELDGLDLRIDSQRLLDCLASPETMVLRAIKTVGTSSTIEEEYTLGHDSVALALERWAAEEAEARARSIEASSKLAKAEWDQLNFLNNWYVWPIIVIVLATPIWGVIQLFRRGSIQEIITGKFHNLDVLDLMYILYIIIAPFYLWSWRYMIRRRKVRIDHLLDE